MKPLLICLLLLTGCSADIGRYEKNAPKLQPEEFFSGQLCAWGTVHDYSEQVSRRFVADIKASASASSFELDEVFVFDDGSTQTRLWKFNKTKNGWNGTAQDVDGIANGQFIGNMMKLTYDLFIETDDSNLIIAMDDELHLIDQDNMIGKTIMTKFGLKVGEINLVIQKQNNRSLCSIRDANDV